MERKLNEYVILRDSLIYDIYIADADFQVLEVNNRYSYLSPNSAYKNLREEKQTGFTELQYIKYGSSGGQWHTFGYVSDIYNREPPYPYMGKLVILLNIDELTAPLRFDRDSGIYVELYNDQAGLMYSSDPQRDSEGETAGSADYLFRHDLGVPGWHALCAVSGRQVSDSLSQINTIIIGIVAIVLIFMLSIIGRITTNIVSPLKTLIRGMRQVSEGSRSERIVVTAGDEIQEAARVFNQMVSDIDHHTQEQLDSEKKEHESHLQMLLYQINPHFIYNTLNCVICLARNEDHDSIIHLVRVFITFLRTILRVDPKGMTTLSEEIVYMDNYVRILQYSYRNVQNLIWEVDEELREIPLPKLILYPFVENAIFYGVIPSETRSSVTIRVCREGEFVTVSVQNTGRGMEQDALHKVRWSLDSEESIRDHIGMLRITADRYAHCVELSGGSDGEAFGYRFSDNYFALFPDETKCVSVQNPEAAAVVTARAAYGSSTTRVEFEANI